MVYAISSGCHRTVPIITADFYESFRKYSGAIKMNTG